MPVDHKIQTDKRALVPFGGARQDSVGYHLGSNPARDALAPVSGSPKRGAAGIGKPAKRAISGLPDDGWSPQTQGLIVSRLLQQQDSAAGHNPEKGDRRSTFSATAVARKQNKNATTFIRSITIRPCAGCKSELTNNGSNNEMLIPHLDKFHIHIKITQK